MNIYLHELKALRRSTLFWTLALIALIYIFLSMFPALADDAEEFRKILEGYPEAVRKAFSVSLDSITSLLGFYSFAYGYILLCGSIQAMHLGVSIISKEVREKTADFLLTKPVTRSQIMTAKILAALTSLVFTNGIYLGVSSIIALQLQDQSFDLKLFLMITITVFFVQLMFLAMGILVAQSVSKIKSVLPISLGTVFGFFVIGMLGAILDDDAIRYITPFKYYDVAYIQKHASYETSFIVLEIILIAACGIVSYVIYAKKDIHSV